MRQLLDHSIGKKNKYGKKVIKHGYKSSETKKNIDQSWNNCKRTPEHYKNYLN